MVPAVLPEGRREETILGNGALGRSFQCKSLALGATSASITPAHQHICTLLLQSPLCFAGVTPPLQYNLCPRVMGDLIKDCWAHSPDNRPSMAQVVDRLTDMECDYLNADLTTSGVESQRDMEEHGGKPEQSQVLLHAAHALSLSPYLSPAPPPPPDPFRCPPSPSKIHGHGNYSR